MGPDTCTSCERVLAVPPAFNGKGVHIHKHNYISAGISFQSASIRMSMQGFGSDDLPPLPPPPRAQADDDKQQWVRTPRPLQDRIFVPSLVPLSSLLPPPSSLPLNNHVPLPRIGSGTVSFELRDSCNPSNGQGSVHLPLPSKLWIARSTSTNMELYMNIRASSTALPGVRLPA